MAARSPIPTPENNIRQIRVQELSLSPRSETAAAPADPSAQTGDALLDFLVDAIREATSCVEAAIFEYGRAARKHGHTTPVACNPQTPPAPEIVHALINDARSQAGTSDCFSLGPIGANDRVEVLGLRFSTGEDVFLRGYARFDGKAKPEEWNLIRTICTRGARIVSEIRKERARNDTEAAGRAFQSRMFDSLCLGSDAYWEADSSGIIRNVVLHRNAEANLIRLLEGRNLNAIAGKAEVLRSAEFRDLKFEASSSERSGGQSVELSGRSMPDGSWQGIARLLAKGRDSLSAGQARSFIEELEASRDHEAALRRETELILDGLRILTSGHSRRELFKQLLDSLAPALEFQAAVILWRDWAGKIAARVGSAPELLTLDWQDAGDRLFAIDEVAVALTVPKDLNVPIPGDGPGTHRSALAVKLRGGSKAAVMLCLHTRPSFFGARHLGLGTRLALIASQAFMNEEERQKVVDSSQLATIGEMAAGIVHEINQPLTAMTFAINNLTEMAEGGAGLDPEKLAAKLAKLQGQVDRVSKIVANMRVLARHSDGTVEPFDIKSAVDEAAGIINHKLHKGAIDIEIGIEDGLKANGNALEFSQVVLNLLSNAHDAILSAPKSDKPKRITISGKTIDAQWSELTVRDTGTGFPEEGAQRAFEAFFTTKEVGKGTGLGLALCRRIVENMGGSIVLGNWEMGAQIVVRLKRTAD